MLANAASGVVELIQGMGGDPDRVFGPSRVAPEDLDEPMAPIPLKSFCDLFELAAAETRNDNFGLAFGTRFEVNRLGVIGYLVVNAPTLGAALNVMCEWFPVHQQDTVLRLRHTPQASYLEYRIYNGNVSKRRQDAELSLSLFANVFRYCLGPRWTPLRVEFEHPKPASVREHQAAFGCTPMFGASCNSIMFRSADLATLTPRADPLLLSTLLSLVQGHAQALQSAPQDFPGLVKELIRERSMAGDVCQQAIADSLEMPIWTLYRKLKEHGTTFNDLVRDTRQSVAVDCVAQPHIPLTEIALMLGYSELSAFSRAFRSWSGLSPTQYRRRARESRSG